MTLLHITVRVSDTKALCTLDTVVACSSSTEKQFAQERHTCCRHGNWFHVFLEGHVSASDPGTSGDSVNLDP